MVIPVGDVNPTRRRPVLTITFVVANVLVFLLVQPRTGGCAELQFLYRWAAVPEELLSLRQLDAGIFREPVARCLADMGEKSVLLSAVTAMFLHANVGHLLGNMLFLWVFGNNVEDVLGRVQFVVFYVVGGLVATYAFALLNADAVTPLLGASGAVAAVLGAYLILFPRARVRTYVPFPLYLLTFLIGARIVLWLFFFAVVELPAWLVLGFWFLLQLGASASAVAGGGVAFEAHVAGFVAGIVLVLLLGGVRRRRAPPPRPVW